MTLTNSMLGQKSITAIAVSIAVVVAAIAAIIVSGNRAAEAEAYAAAEEAEANFAEATNKIARAQADAERARQKAAEADKEAKASELAAQKELRATTDSEQKTAEENRRTAEANAATEQARVDAARLLREAAVASNQTVRAELDRAAKQAVTAQAKADAEAAKLAQEKLKADKIIAEAKAMELRKIDYETLERDLLEWKLDLEERERALKPEKTIASLDWAGGMEDTIVDDKGNVTKQVKKKYDPEKDMTLPEQARRLARTNRKVRETQEARLADTRDTVVKTMEKLYVSALKEGRVIDADFYKKNILIMYPDWKFKGEEPR